MNFNQLPTEYSQIKLAELEKREKEIQRGAQAKIEGVTAKYKNQKKQHIYTSFEDYFGCICIKKYVKVALIGGTVAGFLGGLFLYFLTELTGGHSSYAWYICGLLGIVTGLAFFFVSRPIYGAILGAVLIPICYPIYLVICKVMNKKADEHNFSLDSIANNEISKIEHNAKTTINELNKKAKQEISEYTCLFEKEAQKLSVNFANSTLAKEVIEWLATGFLKTVKAANRASHIEKIVVPFDFHVEKGEIRCNIGRYNFEEHRCERLQNVLAQTALARAIASQVQLNMIMQYDKDTSGTEYKIDITYKYPEQVKSSYYSSQPGDYVSAHLVYTASNGNYKPIQKW